MKLGSFEKIASSKDKRKVLRKGIKGGEDLVR